MGTYYRQYSEAEAFSYAVTFWDRLTADHPRVIQSKGIVALAETEVFRPALELVVAGLALLSGKPRNEFRLPASLAFFVVDHLALGWCAVLTSHFRVAYTLSRSAIEAAIFQVASALNPVGFSNLWNTPQGTGGSILNQMANSFPEDVHAILRRAWELTKPFGHPSGLPVVSSDQIVYDESLGRKIGVFTFGGPYIEPLNEAALQDLSIVYGVGAFAALEATRISFEAVLQPFAKWQSKYALFRAQAEAVAERAAEKIKREPGSSA